MYSYQDPWGTNKAAMGCESTKSILSWLDEFWNMCWFGIVFVGLGSIGNSAECKKAWKPLVGFVFVLGLVLGNCLYVFLYTKQYTQEQVVAYVCSLFLGIATASLHLGHAASICFSPATMQKMKACLPKVYKLFSGTVFAEMNVKQAGALKLANLIKNALAIVKMKDIENVVNTHYGQALANYATSGKKFVECGGLRWSMSRILGSDITFEREGIWLPARMLAGNIAQIFVVFWVLLGGIRLTDRVITDFDNEVAKETFRNLTSRAFDIEATDQLAEEMAANINASTQEALLAGSGFDQESFSGLLRDTVYTVSENNVDSLYPS